MIELSLLDSDFRIHEDRQVEMARSWCVQASEQGCLKARQGTLNIGNCKTMFLVSCCCCSQTLESLCTNLYDALRPLIIHINHLETLAELCSILKVC